MSKACGHCEYALVPLYHPKDLKEFPQESAVMWLMSYLDYSQKFDKLISGDWHGHRAT